MSKDSWRLKIDGLVDNPMELTFDDLLARPQVERYITLSCVSNPVGGDLVGNALWQGVLLKDILDEAGLQPGAEQLASRSIDGWTCGTPVEVIMDGRDAMLAIAMNGEPLPALHGYPVRMVVPGLYGYVSATKWVTDMRLTRWEDFDGYWIPRGWSKLGPVKTMARIDTPRTATHDRVGEVAIGGVAWAVHRGVSAVQVRVERPTGCRPGPGSTPNSVASRRTTRGSSGCTGSTAHAGQVLHRSPGLRRRRRAADRRAPRRCPRRRPGLPPASRSTSRPP